MGIREDLGNTLGKALFKMVTPKLPKEPVRTETETVKKPNCQVDTNLYYPLINIETDDSNENIRDKFYALEKLNDIEVFVPGEYPNCEMKNCGTYTKFESQETQTHNGFIQTLLSVRFKKLYTNIYKGQTFYIENNENNIAKYNAFLENNTDIADTTNNTSLPPQVLEQRLHVMTQEVEPLTDTGGKRKSRRNKKSRKGKSKQKRKKTTKRRR